MATLFFCNFFIITIIIIIFIFFFFFGGGVNFLMMCYKCDDRVLSKTTYVQGISEMYCIRLHSWLPWHGQDILRWFLFLPRYYDAVSAANGVLKCTWIFYNDISHLCNEISWQYGVWHMYYD